MVCHLDEKYDKLNFQVYDDDVMKPCCNNDLTRRDTFRTRVLARSTRVEKNCHFRFKIKFSQSKQCSRLRPTRNGLSIMKKNQLGQLVHTSQNPKRSRSCSLTLFYDGQETFL